MTKLLFNNKIFLKKQFEYILMFYNVKYRQKF